MKCLSRRAFALSLVCAAAAQAQTPLTTAFTYQGQLKLSGGGVNATAGFQFSLFTALTAGTQGGSTISVNSVTGTGGLFAAQLDFCAAAFNGDMRFLQIAVRSPAGAGTFTTLSPRQSLTATPYALQTRGMFVDANNLVGIGTTAPQTKVHIKGAQEAVRIEGPAAGAANLAYM